MENLFYIEISSYRTIRSVLFWYAPEKYEKNAPGWGTLPVPTRDHTSRCPPPSFLTRGGGLLVYSWVNPPPWSQHPARLGQHRSTAPLRKFNFSSECWNNVCRSFYAPDAPAFPGTRRCTATCLHGDILKIKVYQRNFDYRKLHLYKFTNN